MSVRVDTIGRYRLDEVLGHGGMAVVYRGHDGELDRPVAIKLLADNLAADEGFRERFVREARIAAGLAHPNIARVYDTGEEDGRPYIVMECVEGESLDVVLAREGRLAPARAVALAVQACAGLQHAHLAGLVHRDVKPQNLILRDDGNLKIVDFGIARAAEGTRLTEVGSILGTAAYLAPEQALGKDVTSAADVYATGAVLYELLTGRPPFAFETLEDLVGAQERPLVRPIRNVVPEVPPELENLVMRCLALLPEYRPASAAELGAELEAIFRELPTGLVSRSDAPTRVASAPPPATRLRPAARLHPALLLAGAIALAAILGLAIVLGRGGGHGTRKPAPAAPASAPASRPAVDQARALSAWLRANMR